MDKMLHLLETFTARGSDGQTYRVQPYEHLACLGAMTLADTGVRLKRSPSEQA